MGSLWDGIVSLGANINKVVNGDSVSEGDVGRPEEEVKVDIDDKVLLKMSKEWITAWDGYKADVEKRQKKNKDYWLGKQFEESVLAKENAIVDNRVFTDIETLIPIVAGQNPEPLVMADPTISGAELSNTVSKHLAYQADIQKLKIIIQQSVRNWTLDLIGVVKYGWDRAKDDIVTKVMSAKKLILDPDATIGIDGYTGDYIGEYKEERADKVIESFPNMEAFIKKEVKNKMWTKIKYIEW